MKLPFGPLSCCCLLAAFGVSTTSSSDGAAWFDGGVPAEDREGGNSIGFHGPNCGPNFSTKCPRCRLKRILLGVIYYYRVPHHLSNLHSIRAANVVV